MILGRKFTTKMLDADTKFISKRHFEQTIKLAIGEILITKNWEALKACAERAVLGWDNSANIGLDEFYEEQFQRSEKHWAEILAKRESEASKQAAEAVYDSKGRAWDLPEKTPEPEKTLEPEKEPPKKPEGKKIVPKSK